HRKTLAVVLLRQEYLSASGTRDRVGRGAATLRSPHTPASQFSSSAAPASPDFSGWNCVAVNGPFSTAATNRSPSCSAQVTNGAANGPVDSISQCRAA